MSKRGAALVPNARLKPLLEKLECCIRYAWSTDAPGRTQMATVNGVCASQSELSATNRLCRTPESAPPLVTPLSVSRDDGLAKIEVGCAAAVGTVLLNDTSWLRPL